MATNTMNQQLAPGYGKQVSRPSLWTTFIGWCIRQESRRLMWVGLTILIHGCLLTPLTTIIVMHSAPEVPMLPYAGALISMVMVLVANLAAMPTKITLPVFAFSILLDLVIIASVLLG